MTETRPHKPPRVRNLIAFSALIMLVFCIIVGVQATRSYDVAVKDGKDNASRLTRIVSDHVEQIFLSADLTIQRAVERQYLNTLFGGNLPRYMESNFRLWVDENPQIVAMALINADGVVEVAAHKPGYARWIDYGRPLIGEDMFDEIKNGEGKNFLISRYTSKMLGRPLIFLTRKYTRLDGSFGGIVVGALDPAYFIDFFQSVERGNKRYMSLMLTDKTMLITGSAAGRVTPALVDSIFAAHPRMEFTETPITETRNQNNALSIVSYKKLKSLPLAVTIVLEEQDFLAAWRSARIKDIGFLAIFTVFGAVLSFFALTMAKQIVYVEESEAAAILASQAKSEFLANMSHELRTPLNAIIGFSEMMASGYFGPMNAKQKERVNDIHLCGTHLLQLITDILEFSKGDAGKLELNEEVVDVAEILRESVRMMQERMKSKNIHLNVDIAKDLPCMLADKRKIRQILLNLMSNAAKFTPEEGSVKVAAKMDQNGNMNLIVADSGIGIAEEDIPTALSVFGQVHRSKSHEGTGLGLPLCKMFAELHGGKITLASAVGEGTTVRVILPHSRVIHAEERVVLEQANRA